MLQYTTGNQSAPHLHAKRKKITSSYTDLLYKKYLPIEAQKAHIFPGLKKALLSIGTFFDNGLQAIFDDKTVLIINKGSGKVMMRCKRDPRSNM